MWTKDNEVSGRTIELSVYYVIQHDVDPDDFLANGAPGRSECFTVLRVTDDKLDQKYSRVLPSNFNGTMVKRALVGLHNHKAKVLDLKVIMSVIDQTKFNNENQIGDYELVVHRQRITWKDWTFEEFQETEASNELEYVV